LIKKEKEKFENNPFWRHFDLLLLLFECLFALWFDWLFISIPEDHSCHLSGHLMRRMELQEASLYTDNGMSDAHKSAHNVPPVGARRRKVRLVYWIFSSRNYRCKPMKFEDNIFQKNVFKMRLIPIFYDKYFFRYFNWNSVQKCWKIFIGPFYQEIIALNQWNSREIFSNVVTLKWDRFQYSTINAFLDILTETGYKSVERSLFDHFIKKIFI